ncbi:MAG: hypothetical protein MZV65_44240 [Chromatiales bacterium]|nr:hypothetical protein [Chromatiales bacterium]
MTVLDGQRELIGAALKYLGHSVNETDPKRLRAGARPDPARQALLGGVQRLVLHQGADDRQHLARARLLERHVPGAAGRAGTRRRPFAIGYATPKEGAVLAIDSMVLHKSGPRPDLAHRFIDFMLEGRNSADLTNLIGSGNPNADAMQYIHDEMQGQPGGVPRRREARSAWRC